MTLSVKSTIAGTALALAVSAAGAMGVAGTAYAAVPGHISAASSIALQNPPPHPGPHPGPGPGPGPQHPGPQPHRPPPSPPHRFHSRYNTEALCRAQAMRDHPGHPELWDCRRGPDHNNPWEYWGS